VTGNVASSDARDLPVRVVARILACDTRYVKKLIRAGLFPNAYLLPGCGWRIPDDDVKVVRQQLRISIHTSA
jgi:hypothetical protein